MRYELSCAALLLMEVHIAILDPMLFLLSG